MLLHSIALAVTLASVHVPDHNYNQQNYGVGLQYNAPAWAISVGEYRNSFNRRTVYELAAWFPFRDYNWSYGVAGGHVTGYKSPFAAALVARYAPSYGPGVNVMFAPPANNSSAIVGLQVTWGF